MINKDSDKHGAVFYLRMLMHKGAALLLKTVPDRMQVHTRG